VEVHTTCVGGGFGARVVAGVVEEAVALARTEGRPIQLVRTREDDMRHAAYKPCTAHVVSAVLTNGRVSRWEHRIVGSGVEGAKPPYALGDVIVTQIPADPGVATGLWRGVDHVQNAFVVETMVSEMAARSGTDPITFRTRLLRGGSREAAVLRALAGMLPEAPPAGTAMGVALHGLSDSVMALAAEVAASPDETPAVSRVWCAVDCGRAVDPDGVRAQIEGGVAFGLCATLYGGVKLRSGRVVQGNFDAYRVLRLTEMPRVEVQLLASEDAPGGVGELAVPCIGPAVASAWRSLRPSNGPWVLPLVPSPSADELGARQKRE
jgi:isoquinoline 1-oxidoreductase beta subunit